MLQGSLLHDFAGTELIAAVDDVDLHSSTSEMDPINVQMSLYTVVRPVLSGQQYQSARASQRCQHTCSSAVYCTALTAGILPHGQLACSAHRRW